MSITQKQIDLLRNSLAYDKSETEKLIQKWEHEIYTKELLKNDNVEFLMFKPVYGQNKEQFEKCIGKKVSESFAIAKSESKYGLYHIKTGRSAIIGSKNTVSDMVKDLLSQEWFKELDEELMNITFEDIQKVKHFSEFVDICFKHKK